MTVYDLADEIEDVSAELEMIERDEIDDDLLCSLVLDDMFDRWLREW